MPDPHGSQSRRLLVGGKGSVRFAVALEQVEGVRQWAELSGRPRLVNLPLLFDLPTAAPEEDRYARVTGLEEPSYVRLGPAARAEELDAATVIPVPRILRTTAARWGWLELAVQEDGVIVVVDPVALARIGARRQEISPASAPLDVEEVRR